ncbi:MAG: helix-turn-helix domain-containing protein [Phenylobacterium sp.]|uniref:helix-turn-helix domain-containing protein n=1 Tax=Phenylobacterium sp. TaxID=1871053 RepID=UPI0012156DCD|nr:helix-turn-helix domain-containing protein [Phenylobacterium sp.]TAL34947.1 MAG: helix-turn-helix domain-containing protein [Phenylobacterium sp.]
MSFAALGALRAIDDFVAARREQGFDDLDQFDGLPPDEIGCSALLVLYVLAEYAGADGYAFPSQKTLAKRCRLHDRTVRGILLALERWGLIERQPRIRKDGTWTSDRIRLAYYQPEQQPDSDCSPAGLRPAGGLPRQRGASPKASNQRASGPPDQRASGTDPAGLTPDPTTFEPVTETITSPRKRELDADFETWWEIYPRKTEKRAARELFEAAIRRHGATVDELLSAAQRYAIEVHGRDLSMVKNPTTWLQRQCWFPEAEAAVLSSPEGFPGPEFDLPPRVVSDLFAAAPDVGACLHGATWREEDRTIVTVRRWGADELVKRVGAVRLRALGLRAEAAAGGR